MSRLLAFVSVAFASVGVLVALPLACAAAQGTGDLPVEIVTPAQHTQGINSSAFSRDNDDRFVATSGYDAVIKLWDVRTGRLIRNVVRIDQNNKYWRVKSLSTDGRRLLGIVASEYKVWNTLTGAEVLTIPAGDDTRDDDPVFMSRDGSRIAAMRSDKTVKLFDAQTGKELTTLRNLVAITFSADGKRWVAASADNKIELWDAQSGARIRTLMAVNEPVKSLLCSADGRRIAVRGASGAIQLWDSDSNRLLAELAGGEQSSSVFSPDGVYWAFHDGKEAVTILNAETGATYSKFKPPADKASLLQLSSDNRLIYFSPASAPPRPDWVVVAANASTGALVHVANGTPDEDFHFGSRLYIEDDDGTLRLSVRPETS